MANQHYPGGGVRNHFEPVQSMGESIFRLIVGGLLSVAIVADDAFGIVADEPLFIETSSYFVSEWVIWKKVCTVCREEKMNIDIEKLEYFLIHMEDKLCRMTENVLQDSKEDPHYSAVTVTNLIKCYIQIMKELGEECPYDSVESFFEYNLYTKEEFEAFEENRKKESVYYRGVQY